MIKKVRDVGLKSIKHNKFIIISSIVSIIMSLIIFISMINYINNSEKSLMDDIHKVYGELDVGIGYETGSDKKINKVLLNKILNDKVEQYSEVLIDFKDIEGNRIYTLGLQDNELARSRYKYNIHINKSDDVVINNGVAQLLNKKVNDSIVIDNKCLKIKEILNNDEKNIDIPNMIIMDIDNLRGEKNKNLSTYIMIKFKDNVDEISYASNIKNIDKELVVDLINQNEDVKDNLQSLKVFVIIIGIFIVIMSGLLISINFDTFLYKYRKDFSIIRSVGGSVKQAFEIVLVQSIFINLVGCVLGFIISYILNSTIISFISNIFNLKIATVEFSIFQSLIITIATFMGVQIMMLIPAYKASKILPLKIVEENEKILTSKKSNVLSYIFFGAGALLYLFGMFIFKAQDNTMIYCLISAILIIISIIIYVKRNTEILLSKLLNMIQKTGVIDSYIVLKNMIPQVKRYSSIILAISILFSIITFSSNAYELVVNNSMKYIKGQNHGDVNVVSVLKNYSKIGYSIKDELQEINKEACISFISDTPIGIKLDKKNDDIYTGGLMDFEPFIKNGVIKGSDNLPQSVLITKDFASKNNLSVGSTVRGESIGECTVIDIVDSIPGHYGQIALDWSNKVSQEYLKDTQNVASIFGKLIIFSENIDEVKSSLNILKGKYPELKWNTLEELLKEDKEYIFQRWSLIILAVGMILIIIVLGIINSLINDINNRRGEYALLRVMELTPKRMVKVIVLQTVVYLTLGVLVGITMGEIISSMVMSSEGKLIFKFNYRIILLFILIVYTMVNSIVIPFARKTSKMKIIDELKV